MSVCSTRNNFIYTETLVNHAIVYSLPTSPLSHQTSSMFVSSTSGFGLLGPLQDSLADFFHLKGLPSATSPFEEHSLLETINTAVGVMSIVAEPFVARIADITSRPTAFSTSLAFYLVGLIVMASSISVNSVAAGKVRVLLHSTRDRSY